VALPPRAGGAGGGRRVDVESADGRRFVSMHYWAYAFGAAPAPPRGPEPPAAAPAPSPDDGGDGGGAPEGNAP
jgi:hypothetical protein